MSEQATKLADAEDAEMPMPALLAVLDHARIGYALTDAEGLALVMSEGFAELTSLDLATLDRSRPWFLLDHASEEEKAERSRLWAAFVRQGRPWHGWVRWCTADGLVRHFEGTSRPLPDGRVVLVNNDRSEEREAGRAVERAIDLQRNVLDDLPISVALQDHSGRIIYCNRFVPDRVGVPVDAVVGKMPQEIPFIGMDARLMKLVRSARENGEAIDGEPLEVEEGVLAGTHWLFYARPLYDRQGRPQQFLTVGVDRTAGAALDREREGFAKALAETQKIGALNDFAGSLAHELSNILHPVGVYGRALAEDPDRPDRKQLAERIRAAAMNAGRILKRTLSMARSETGLLERHDVSRIVEEVVASARDLAPQGLRYELHLPEGGAPALVRPTELRQVLLNLLNNAADAQHYAGTVRVLVERGQRPPRDLAVQATAAGAFASIRVADEGAGMDAETRVRVFEPFFTTKKAGRGTGLGLPVVQGLVTGWGGVVSIETERGTGSAFTVWIPEPPSRPDDEGDGARNGLAREGGAGMEAREP